LGDSLRIGPFRLPEPLITLIDGRREPIGDGMLGMDVLSRFTITLDQANKRVRFANPATVLASPPPILARHRSRLPRTRARATRQTNREDRD
jgi:hypothetical protein